MKTILPFLLGLLTSGLPLAGARAQDYPVLRRVAVNAVVTRDSLSGMFYYSYSLFNDAANRGSIQAFRLDLRREQGSVVYDTVGLQFAGKSFMRDDFRERYPHLAPHFVPIGFSRLPGRWEATWGNAPEASVSIITAFVPPGDSVLGLTFMSRGLPGIRWCLVEPNVPLYLYPSLEYDDDTTQERKDSLVHACSFQGFTVAPWAPDSLFRPVVFVDTLIAFVRRSHALGWIPDQAITQKYLSMLAGVRASIALGQKADALAALQTVLQAVTSDQGSALRPEAVALLRFNGEYCCRKLR